MTRIQASPDLHHPSEETLLRHAAGHLGAGPSLVLSAHLEGCAQCRAIRRGFEAVGGVLLEGTPGATMTAGSLDRALAVIAGAPRIQTSSPIKTKRPKLPEGVAWPMALASYDIGPWRWLAPGMHISRIRVPEAGETKVALLRIGPGKKLLQHSHAGTEWTFVVSGSFKDEDGTFPAGSFIEADDHVEHQPFVDSNEACICLVAVEGHLHVPGLAGRLMRLYVGL